MKISVCLVLYFLGLVAYANGESPTKSQIAQQVREALSGVESIKTRVSMHPDEVPVSSENIELCLNGAYFSRFDEFAIDRTGKRQYRLRKYWSAASAEEFQANRFSVWNQEWTICDGSRYLGCATETHKDAPPKTIAASILPLDTQAPGKFDFNNVYHESTGCLFHKFDTVDMQRIGLFVGREFSLLNILEDPEYAVISSEMIGGKRAWLLQSNDKSDSLWLGADLGFCVIKRVCKSGDRGLAFTYLNSDFEQVVDDIWLPKNVSRSITFDSAQNPGLTVHCTLDAVEANRLPTDQFQMTFPPGAVIADGTAVGNQLVQYTAGATQESTEKALQNAIDITAPAFGWGWIGILVVLNATVIILIIATVMLRGKKA